MRKSLNPVWAAVAAMALSGGVVRAAPDDDRAGSIIGVVTSTAGIPQMGATVVLFNRADRLVDRAMTNDKGVFAFASLMPDIYTIRVHLVSFMPAVRDGITLQPGMRSFLSINLASVLSSIELVYNAPGQGPLMSDDWKWVLRSSMATRPVLRFAPIPSGTQADTTDSVFSNTRGLVSLSAGDGASAATGAQQADLGTAFALATSFFGPHQLQVSGNLGYGSRLGTPTAAFRTSLMRGSEGGTNAALHLTMRQVFLPGRAGGAVMGQSGNTPLLRTMAASFVDRAQIGENVDVDFGATLESVQFLSRLNFLSPFARVSYKVLERDTLEFGFSSGLPPSEIVPRSAAERKEFETSLSALSAFPRLTLRNSRPEVQRTEQFEAGYRRTARTRTYAVAVSHARVSNGAMLAASAGGLLPPSDLLPDLFSNAAIFNVGSYTNIGASAAITQDLGDSLSVTLGYGNSGVLKPSGREFTSGDPNELRSMISMSRKNWASARINAVAPRAGTQVTASYLHADYHGLIPAHGYLTQSARTDIGLNVWVRQPIPSIGGMPGRFEATAELRNLMAQGFVPVATGDGGRLVLMQTPRLVRGGVSFIF